MKPDLKSLTLDEISRVLIKQGHPAYRSSQVVQWAYERTAESFDAMSSLSLPLRQWLAAEFDLWTVKELREQHSTDTTEKFLWRLRDGQLVETVLIPATPGLTSRADRHTVCVSTQVGCAYGCRFCASGLNGFRRNLTAGEIVDQVLAIVRMGRTTGILVGEAPAKADPEFRAQNLVIMGMGEPLANYDNLMKALKIINAPWGLNIGSRKITVSTCGLPAQIKKLATEPMQVRLAVSLHGTNDKVREQLLPINRKHPLSELMEACEYYAKTKGRMMTFEYILIEGVNDDLNLADQLSAMARRLHAKVNLIPYNPVESLHWRRPSMDRCHAFAARVKSRGVAATLRIEKGGDIAAACGQLRLQTMREAPPAAPVAS
ncbi:MAG: 23S rRNA (adenine(2503)-C(2))-methyltransferase RlmN [Verrucomicrobia bacterium]|nr:23S rRNA (adenine(2503)-C(2))-methyltransferase RlmN [Verrucomicrobiota bacterium]